jgi:hypothetical protein
MTTAKRYRHGDVLLSPIQSVPVSAREIPHSGEYTLAYGEATGHHHRLRVAEPSSMKVFTDKGTLYVQLMEIGTLVHEEHHQLEIVPAVYRMSMEIEYDPFERMMKKVVD